MPWIEHGGLRLHTQLSRTNLPSLMHDRNGIQHHASCVRFTEHTMHLIRSTIDSAEADSTRRRESSIAQQWARVRSVHDPQRSFSTAIHLWGLWQRHDPACLACYAWVVRARPLKGLRRSLVARASRHSFTIMPCCINSITRTFSMSIILLVD